MRQIHRAFPLFFFFWYTALPNNALALPQKYTIIAQEEIRNFTFQEDQPWIKSPRKISFQDIISNEKITILHLWATSCRSCIKELKSLELLAKKHKNNPIQIISLSLNDPRPGVLRNYFNNQRYTHLKPYHRASSKRPPIKGLPTTLFFNRNGKLIGRIEGPANWQGAEMTKLIKRILETPFQKPKKNTAFYTLFYNRIQAWFS